MRRARWLAIAGMVTGGIAGPAESARAQAPDPVALEEAAYEDFAAGRLDRALRGYERLYRLAPRPELQFAIGNLQQRLGECERAIATLEQYVATNPITGADKARALIAACRATLPVAAPIEPMRVAPSGAAARPARDRGRGRRRAALVVGSLAVVATGAAITTELLGRAELDDCVAIGPGQFTSACDTADRYHYAAQGAAGFAAAAAVTATILWITGRHRRDTTTAMTPIRGGAVMTWGGGF